MAIPVIGLYNGASPPSGAYVCNGSSCPLGSTPDLRNKFIMCAGSSYGLLSTGGADTKALAAHTHSLASHTPHQGRNVGWSWNWDQRDEQYDVLYPLR